MIGILYNLNFCLKAVVIVMWVCYNSTPEYCRIFKFSANGIQTLANAALPLRNTG